MARSPELKPAAITATDAFSHASDRCLAVVVPKSQSAKDVASVSAQAAAALSQCPSPAGYFVIEKLIASVPRRASGNCGEHAPFGMSRGRLRSMPTIRRDGPYRFYFYSSDLGEPRHVHVDAGESTAKFWLVPVSLHYNIGFSARELRAIERDVLDHRQAFVEAWDANLGT